MEKNVNAYKASIGKLEGKRQPEKPKVSWEDNVRN
jgi:hypothetical protein